MRKNTLLALSLLCASFMASEAEVIKHPSLIITPERVAAAKEMMKSDAARQQGWKAIQKRADELLSKDDYHNIEYLALAYMMTGQKKYSDKIIDLLKKASETKSWGNGEMLARKPAWRSELQMAWKAMQCAEGYDVVYDLLSPDERKKIADGLYRLAVEPLLGDWLVDSTRIHSLNSMGHNWWTACINGGAMLALAIGNERPDAAQLAEKAVESLPEWFDFAGDVIQHKPKTFDRDGGMYESINYASFGTTSALKLRLAWLNAHPDAKLEDIPQMHQLGSFFCNVAYPRNGQLYSINFGDSHKNVTGESSMILAYAMGAESPETLWYINQVDPDQFHEGYPLRFPMGFLYSPDNSAAPVSPDLPTSHLWKDFGWATMRDSWKKDATMLAVKSGMTWNHSHADANSLILFHKGVDIIKDAGNSSYGTPEYRKYFFQSDAHNIVKFNGQGQPTYQQYHGTMLPGSVSSLLDGGNIKYVMADGTGPMSRWLDRNFRHYLWIDDVIYVIDDLHSHEPGTFEWVWHPGGEAVKRGYDLEITNGASSAIIRPIFPRPLAYSNFVHDYPEDMYWETHEGPTENLKGKETYWSFHLPGARDNVKGVTAIILKDDPKQKKEDLPQIERREGTDWIGLRIRHDGKVTDLYINQLADGRLMHMNSWIDADGWTTDAYMLAVSYPDGGDPKDPSEMFVCHGSSVRRGGDVYFSTPSKLSAISRTDGDTMRVQVAGQPRVNLAVKGNAGNVEVNGRKMETEKEDGLTRIKYREQ